MIIKNLKKYFTFEVGETQMNKEKQRSNKETAKRHITQHNYFTFEVTVLDDKDVRRRFRPCAVIHVICVDVYTCVCMYIYIYTYTYMYNYAYMYVYIYIYIYIHDNDLTHNILQYNKHICMNVYLSLSLSIYIYIYICIHTYIHTGPPTTRARRA